MAKRELCFAGWMVVVSMTLFGCWGTGDSDEVQWADTLTLAVTGADPTAVETSCAERAAMGASLTAILNIGGRDECSLSTSSVSLTASGACDRTTIGIVRPLALGWWLPDPVTSELVPIALVIDWVDLRKESLGTPVYSVSATLDAAARSTMVRSDAEANALPAVDDNNNESDQDRFNIFEAERWAKNWVTERLVSFDLDNDGLTNLVEACAGTLF